jgi:hypothetical protein
MEQAEFQLPARNDQPQRTRRYTREFNDTPVFFVKPRVLSWLKDLPLPPDSSQIWCAGDTAAERHNSAIVSVLKELQS